MVTLKQVGHKKYDNLLKNVIRAIGENISREDLLQLCLDELIKISQLTAVVILETGKIPNSEEFLLVGVDHRKLKIPRWNEFTKNNVIILKESSQIIKVIESKENIDLWHVNYFKDEFYVLSPIFDVKNGGWLTGINLPKSTARQRDLGLFVWYKTSQDANKLPLGAEQDVRFLELFRHCYQMAGHNIKNIARSIVSQKQELLRDLTDSILSHEVNARISFFYGGLLMLKEQVEIIGNENADNKSPEYNNAYERVTRSINKHLIPHTQKLEKISESVLGLTRRIKSGATYPNKEIFKASELLQHKASDANVLLSVDEDADKNLKIQSDPALVLHIIINLAKNAIESLESQKIDGLSMHKMVSILAVPLLDDEEYEVKLQVIDNGPGVEHHMLDKIFEPGITTKDSGHGLGLPITTMITNYLGGKLTVESNEEKTIFEVYLPKESPKMADLEEELIAEESKK